jgi:tetratricopeptide (TPR) repeat protein
LFEALPSPVEQLGETWVLEGQLISDAGDFVAAADAYARGVAAFEACGEDGWARSARSWLAHGELDLGRTEAAVALLDQARPSPTAPSWFRAFVTAGDARVALQQGDTDRARELALTASAIIDGLPPNRASIATLERLGDVLAATDDASARQHYEDARAHAEAKEDRVAEPRLRAKIEATLRGQERAGLTDRS